MIDNSRYYSEHLRFMGRGRNININRSLEEVDTNPHGRLWKSRLQQSKCTCGENTKRIIIRSGAWRCAISW